MKIMICDDAAKDADQAKKVILSMGGIREDEICICTPQALSLALEVRDLDCDIAILDIEYANQTFSGIDLGKELNQKLPMCQIIYLTWVLDFAPEVYETKHCYFVLKENMHRMLPRAIEKALQLYHDQEEHEVFELHEGGRTLYIRQNDIQYIERENRRLIVHTKNRDYKCYESLTKLLAKLGRAFLRCHGGYVVNYNYIEVVMRDMVRLVEGQELPIGRTYRSSFHEQYMQAMEQHI